MKYDRDLYNFLTSGREDYLEPEYDDTTYYYDPEEVQGMCLDAIAQYLGGSKGMELQEVSKKLYEKTKHGAWLNADMEKVTIESVVEGSDFEFSEKVKFPESTDSASINEFLQEFISLLETCEHVCDEVWTECNGE